MLLFFMMYLLVINELILCLLIICCRIYTLLFNVYTCAISYLHRRVYVNLCFNYGGYYTGHCTLPNVLKE